MRIGVFAKVGWVAMAVLATGAAKVNAQERPSGSRLEVSTVFGALIAGKELKRGVNATGGEQLIAKLKHGGAVGLRAGLHSNWLGLEANLLTAFNRVLVNNEFGVAFPNHGERPLFYTGDALLYPFGKAIRQGRLRPYATSGIGGALFSADLDNIDDQEIHNRVMWNAGGGLKVFADESSAFYLDIRFTNHRLLGSRGMSATDLRSVTVGVGYRF